MPRRARFDVGLVSLRHQFFSRLALLRANFWHAAKPRSRPSSRQRHQCRFAWDPLYLEHNGVSTSVAEGGKALSAHCPLVLSARQCGTSGRVCPLRHCNEMNCFSEPLSYPYRLFVFWPFGTSKPRSGLPPQGAKEAPRPRLTPHISRLRSDQKSPFLGPGHVYTSSCWKPAMNGLGA